MKINPLVIIVFVLVGIIIVQRACNSPVVKQAPVVTVKTDTVWIVRHDTVQGAPRIDKQFVAGKQVRIMDTEWLPIDAIVDTARILRNYFAKNYYPYNIKTAYGSLTILDTISQNKILSRTVINNLRIPEVTTTKTITIQAKPSLQVYLGGSLLGGKDNVLSGFGPDLLLKTKSDQIYQIGAYYTTEGKIAYRAGLMWKVKIHF